ncbi:MAG: orotate phosphoribosyltransferase [Proteobacteria bacterium]|nr:orotate phosphoribosyltransferase [Pseudomonadota bacterium]
MAVQLSQNQRGFIDFLVRSGVLTFGEFMTKSGRKSPYFINTGKFDDGAKILELGEFYAAHIVERGLSNASVIFGPAYKGIPLAVSTSIALKRSHDLTTSFAFDRKEVKAHGDGGRIVGKKIGDGDRIVLVEDVITAGTTMREVIPLLRTLGEIILEGVVIAVDRCERGTGSLSAAQETEHTFGVKVYPIVTIHQIVEHLSEENGSGLVLSKDLRGQINEYISTYGVA